MAFAGALRPGCRYASLLGEDTLAALFAEELGAVIQVRADTLGPVLARLAEAGLGDSVHDLGSPRAGEPIVFRRGSALLYRSTRAELQTLWSETSFRMQSLRDNPDCARQEYEAIADDADPGLFSKLSFDAAEDIAAPFILKARPRVAILREQGVNGQVEMAAAFDRAGFMAVDVHMSDIIDDRVTLEGFVGFAACGGFSYGDVLGAGGGWAKSILLNPRARDEFERFSIGRIPSRWASATVARCCRISPS